MGRRSRSNAGARGRGVMMGRDGEEARDGARRTPRNASRRKRGRPRASAPEEGSLFWLVEVRVFVRRERARVRGGDGDGRHGEAPRSGVDRIEQAAEKAAPEGARGNETVKKRRGRPRKESSRSTVSVKAQSGSVMKRKKTNDGGERRERTRWRAGGVAAVGGFKDEDAFDDDDRSEYDDEEGGEGDEDAGDDDLVRASSIETSRRERVHATVDQGGGRRARRAHREIRRETVELHRQSHAKASRKTVPR